LLQQSDLILIVATVENSFDFAKIKIVAINICCDIQLKCHPTFIDKIEQEN